MWGGGWGREGGSVHIIAGLEEGILSMIYPQCVTMWALRFPLRANVWPQTSHVCGFSPVCTR